MNNFLLSFFLIDLSDLEVIWHRTFILVAIAQRHRVGPSKEGCLARVHLAAAWQAAASGRAFRHRVWRVMARKAPLTNEGHRRN